MSNDGLEQVGAFKITPEGQAFGGPVGCLRVWLRLVIRTAFTISCVHISRVPFLSGAGIQLLESGM